VRQRGRAGCALWLSRPSASVVLVVGLELLLVIGDAKKRRLARPIVGRVKSGCTSLRRRRQPFLALALDIVLREVLDFGAIPVGVFRQARLLERPPHLLDDVPACRRLGKQTRRETVNLVEEAQ
jgi:hypothetical protein